MTKQRDPEKTENPYTRRMQKLAAATPEQVAKMTPKQQAARLAAMHHLHQESEQAHAAEQKTRQESEAQAAARTAQLAASAQRFAMPQMPPMPPVSKGQMAAFLWMPQVNKSLQAFTFPLALLVQTFAQILSSAGLLAADHPARRYEAAKSIGLMALLDEARQNLPPLAALWGTARMAATRQYAMFAATVGVLASGSLTLLTVFTQVFFGIASAWAQVDPPTTSGPGIGTYPIGTSGDYALGFINAIFDPSGQSVVRSGLGDMFRLYSNAMLVFAGIIVLWIIISAVAETARTGVPFGKQFNHIWAPIRLVVALGLLVPLGSGLNSGQYMIIELTKWGSKQTNDVWESFTEKMMVNAGNPEISGALTAVPITTNDYNNIADSAFDAMLCQEIVNQYAAKNPDVGLRNMQLASNAGIIEKEVQPIQTVDASKGLKNAKSLNNIKVSLGTKKIFWQDPNDKTENKFSCGNISFPVVVGQKKLSNGTYTDPQDILKLSWGTINPSDTAAGQFVSSQESSLNQFMSKTRPYARYLAGAALDPATGITEDELDAISAGYNQATEQYVQSRKDAVGTVVRQYGSTFAQDLQRDAKAMGWVSAPVWLNKIAEQNGRVLEAASIVPQVSAFYGKAPIPNLGSTENDAWSRAQAWLGAARQSSVAKRASASTQQSDLMKETFSMMMRPSYNPLGNIATYGRGILSTGLKLVTTSPGQTMSVMDCLESGRSGWSQEKIKTCDAMIDKMTSNALDREQLKSDKNRYAGGTLLPPESPGGPAAAIADAGQKGFGAMMYPVGMMLISFGFLAGYCLPLIPFIRFMIGILGWVMLLFEALLALPLLAISLLKTDGEGFMTQNFQTGAVMVLGIILRPMLMVFGLVLGLIAFNGIIQVVNMTYVPTLANLSSTGGDNSVMSMGVYMLLYGLFVYTLANSAFKAIDILPNQVMSWLGARLDQRMDDASIVQQQSASYTSNLGMISAMRGGSMAGAPAAGGGAVTGNAGGQVGGTGNPAVGNTAAQHATSPNPAGAGNNPAPGTVKGNGH